MDKVTVNCRVCGKPYQTSSKYGRGLYCSNHCKLNVDAGPFEEYIDKSGVCWEWLGRKNQHGYGMFKTTEGEKASHRIAFVLHHKRPIRQMYSICHRCDNPSCVNPMHLFEGTITDNAIDAYVKGRSKQKFFTQQEFNNVIYG